VDQVPVKNPHSTLHCTSGVSWISGSIDCALRAVGPPNLHITPDVGAIDAGDQGGGQCRTDAGYFIEPFARLIGSVPGHDLPVKLEDLGFQHVLDPESSETGARYLGQPPITCIGDHSEQVLDTAAPNPGDDTKLGRWARIALITLVRKGSPGTIKILSGIFAGELITPRLRPLV
jgi:hypothetical protein